MLTSLDLTLLIALFILLSLAAFAPVEEWIDEMLDRYLRPASRNSEGE